MIPLPQRKKSAEEIARLRESFGVSAASPMDPQGAADAPVDESEWAPKHADGSSMEAKAVKSLLKSEQLTLPAAQHSLPAPESKLPIQRRTAEELNAIRRKEAISLQIAQTPIPKLAAHMVLIILGYLLMLVPVFLVHYEIAALEVSASCVAAGLLIAGFIAWRKPLSRHHAAFISVIALFVTVFGVLHYFPQLRYGS